MHQCVLAALTGALPANISHPNTPILVLTVDTGTVGLIDTKMMSIELGTASLIPVHGYTHIDIKVFIYNPDRRYAMCETPSHYRT